MLKLLAAQPSWEGKGGGRAPETLLEMVNRWAQTRCFEVILARNFVGWQGGALVDSISGGVQELSTGGVQEASRAMGSTES